jgi:hypothetical protein
VRKEETLTLQGGDADADDCARTYEKNIYIFIDYMHSGIMCLDIVPFSVLWLET